MIGKRPRDVPSAKARGGPVARRSACTAALAAAVLVGAACAQADAAGPRLRLQPPHGANDSATFEVVGLSVEALERLKRAELDRDDWAALLGVYVGDARTLDQGKLPAMLGTWRVEADRLAFRPRFPLEPGVGYVAVFDIRRLPGASAQESSPSRPILAEFSIPRKAARPTTVVQHVYPSRDALPENLLKFYVHFSAPMSRGDIYRHIHLLDDHGAEVELPFLELDEQLWDRRQKRITLLLDPGRIKRGLKPNKDVGSALVAGRSYTLVIDADWPDANGNRLARPFRKSFRADPPDRTSPDPAGWQIESPRVGGRSPLRVTFPEPLDHALVARVLQVRDPADREVRGTVSITEGETRWLFTPDRHWERGEYRLVVSTVLEDLAGNSIGRPFEVDLNKPDQPGVRNPTFELPFRVGAAEDSR